MPRTVTITCDQCDKDVSATDYVPRFRIELSSVALPHTGSMMAAVCVTPPIPETRVFCCVACLKKWVELNL
jgi:hypothetical protein